jgi:hypothetical protein
MKWRILKKDSANYVVKPVISKTVEKQLMKRQWNGP